jgi:hypothetical protein
MNKLANRRFPNSKIKIHFADWWAINFLCILQKDMKQGRKEGRKQGRKMDEWIMQMNDSRSRRSQNVKLKKNCAAKYWGKKC